MSFFLNELENADILSNLGFYNPNEDKEKAAAAKTRGNEHFSKQEWKEAIIEYSKAIYFYNKDPTYYSNRSACYAKTNNFTAALEDGERCIELKPDWEKGYSRVGYALFKLGKLEQAKKSYEDGIEINENDINLTNGLAECKQALKNRDNQFFGSNEQLYEQIFLQKEKKEEKQNLLQKVTDLVTDQVASIDQSILSLSQVENEISQLKQQQQQIKDSVQQIINKNSIDCQLCNGSGNVILKRRMGPMVIQQQQECSYCNGEGRVTMELYNERERNREKESTTSKDEDEKASLLAKQKKDIEDQKIRLAKMKAEQEVARRMDGEKAERQRELQDKQDEIDALRKQLKDERKFAEDDKKSNNNDKENIEIVLARLNDEFESFKKKYNNLQLQEVINKTPEMLMNKDSSINKQINIYKHNIDQILLSSKSFNKYIQDIDGTLERFSNPNPAEYVNWNIVQILVWIKSLDHGRYDKYLDTLKNGFVESDINSADLPDITAADLASPPFSIKSFRDKKNLERHFKSLQISNTPNKEYVNQDNNTIAAEGTPPTAYINH